MADDIHIGIGDGSQDGVCVFPGGAWFITHLVYSGDPQVQVLHVALPQIQGALMINDIDLSSQHQLDAEHLTRDHLQVQKVDVLTGSGNTFGVLSDA